MKASAKRTQTFPLLSSVQAKSQNNEENVCSLLPRVIRILTKNESLQWSQTGWTQNLDASLPSFDHHFNSKLTSLLLFFPFPGCHPRDWLGTSCHPKPSDFDDTEAQTETQRLQATVTLTAILRKARFSRRNLV